MHEPKSKCAGHRGPHTEVLKGSGGTWFPQLRAQEHNVAATTLIAQKIRRAGDVS